MSKLYIVMCEVVIKKPLHITFYNGRFLKGLNMFFASINIPTFRFSPSKILLQFLVPIKFSITTFGPYF